MGHLVVKRVSLALSLLFFAASMFFAWTRSTTRAGPGKPLGKLEDVAADPTHGRELFERHCADCHTPRELRVPLVAASGSGVATLRLLEFLDEHAASSSAEDRAIVAYLLSASPRDE